MTKMWFFGHFLRNTSLKVPRDGIGQQGASFNLILGIDKVINRDSNNFFFRYFSVNHLQTVTLWN